MNCIYVKGVIKVKIMVIGILRVEKLVWDRMGRNIFL